jgi:hypothetical protein
VQYNAGNPANLLQGTWSDPTTIPAQPSDAQIQNEAISAIQHFGLGTSDNIQIVVATPTGYSTPGFGVTWCAYHGAIANYPNVTYTNLPYMTDAGYACGEYSVSGLLDGVSIVEGHELAETITDPLISAWWDASGYEIGDKCAWTDLGTITILLGNFAVQPLWSNAANGCTLATPPSIGLAKSVGTIMHAGAYPYEFMTGADGNLWLNYSNGSSWSWENLGTPGSVGISAAVGVIEYAGADPYAFVTGSDGNLWTDYWTGSAWQWHNLEEP